MTTSAAGRIHGAAEAGRSAPAHAPTLRDAYLLVREASEALCAPLSEEDCVVQSMPDASPAKWHLAHTTWFFETFVLARAVPEYRAFHPRYRYLFNSYYNTVGPMHPRPDRGLLTRPSLADVRAYRRYVDSRIADLLDDDSAGLSDTEREVVELGLHHEQQHQELILTDVKHAFSCNPLLPAYSDAVLPAGPAASSPRWLSYAEGLRMIGDDGESFAFDNEGPKHREFVDAFELASRPVTNGEFIEFVEDGGYSNPDLWLADGWQEVNEAGWKSPLYWDKRDGQWFEFTLCGQREIDPAAPVCHASFYEAHAFTRWVGARLPTEAEWEVASSTVPIEGNFAEQHHLHPVAYGRPDSDGPVGDEPIQMFGDVWEWTRSPYVPYPGYQPVDGALGEYNGKFMTNQIVLRGGSCATPSSHIRPTYRNFFPPNARWQFSGFRLARDVNGAA